MRSDVLTEFVGNLNCDGKLTAVLERISDDRLAELVNNRGPAVVLLTVKLMQAASGAEGITTNMATVKRMFERTLCLLTVENMRRGGFLEVESLPASIADETSFSYRATESGRERFKLLEQMEAKEKAAAGNGAGNGKDTPA